VLLTAFLIALGLVFEPGITWHGQVVRSVLLVVLVLHFRLWDDLADRDYDRLHHPDRLLTRISNVRPFWIFFALLAMVSGAFVFWLSGKQGLLIYIALSGLLFAVYLGPWPFLRHRSVRTQLVLLKYPTFLVLIAPDAGEGVVAAALLAYGALAVHEWFDNRAMRGLLER
jgi:4-hydroxybenzoate polyprenyltransferase